MRLPRVDDRPFDLLTQKDEVERQHRVGRGSLVGDVLGEVLPGGPDYPHVDSVLFANLHDVLHAVPSEYVNLWLPELLGEVRRDAADPVPAHVSLVPSGLEQPHGASHALSLLHEYDTVRADLEMPV